MCRSFTSIAWLTGLLALTACERLPPAVATGLVGDTRIAYTDGLHNENTDLIALDDRIVLVFRGGETGQVGSARAHINVYASFDGGQTIVKQAEVSADQLPGMRDIRDPKLVEVNGTLFLYAISRLPGGHYRDLEGQAWTVRAASTDNGVTWTEPVKTFSDVDSAGEETFWGFWRFEARTSSAGNLMYALGYDDGDTKVGLFQSPDGVSWTKQAIVIDAYSKVPSEAELHFFGDDQQTAVAIVRMDDQGILENGQSAICTSQAPFSAWECGRIIEQRLDGPKWIEHEVNGVVRHFVAARKHLACTDKRTALYELRGDLADPRAHIDVCELAELPSAGDTAYTSLAPLGGDRFLLSWYSTPIPPAGAPDVPWLEGTYSPSDIWLADVDLSRAPGDCNAPPAKEPCPIATLPASSGATIASGDYLLGIAPLIYPSQSLVFRATVSAHDQAFDLSLQPLDASTQAPVGQPWVATNVVLGGGHFLAKLGEVSVPAAAYPLFADPFLELENLFLDGVVSGSGSFCGAIEGYAQVLGDDPSDQIQLAGSTFGAVAISGSALPAVVASCAQK